ncbi:MAG TPA: radical SAM protein [Candidatus Polarisedimenticolaceae bacterium]|nr:radical SAM protein [Candidatus Polarisedimenticolaceae bacterium]
MQDRGRYLDLGPEEIAARAARGREMLRACRMCGRQCGVDRIAAVRPSVCQTGDRAVIAAWGVRHAEQTGFLAFGRCNLRCVFCPTWMTSQGRWGRELPADEVAERMLAIQERGGRVLHLLRPTPVVHAVLEALALAVPRGFTLPLVYESSGYDSVEALRLLDGVVDVYVVDMKWGDSREGLWFSKVRNYASVNRRAVLEMHRQVGDLEVNGAGMALRGLAVRHVVLPGSLASTGRVVQFLAEEISPATWLELDEAYTPAHLAARYAPLHRRPTDRETTEARRLARRRGLRPRSDAAARPPGRCP